MRQRVLVDADGVQCDFISLYLDLHEKLNGKVCKPADVTNFNFQKCIATKDEDERIWRHIDATPGLIRNLPAIEGALEALAELRSFADVICVTSPHTGPTWVPERFQWLQNRAGFKKREIIFASAKEYITGDWFVDDKAEQCIAWDMYNDGMSIVFDAPHNQSHHIGTCERACGWDDVIRLVREGV